MLKAGFLFLLLVFFSFVGIQEVKNIKGSGYVLTEQRELGGFNGVSTCERISVYVVQGESQPITVEADNNLFPYIKTVVRNHTLKAYIPDTVRITKYADMNILLSMPSLTSLKSVTNSFIDASPQRWQTDTITLTATTGGRIKLHVTAQCIKIIAQSSAIIELKGEARKLVAELKTDAHLDARELEVESADIQIATGAKADLKVNGTITYDLNGYAKLILHGNPRTLGAEVRSGSKIIRENN